MLGKGAESRNGWFIVIRLVLLGSSVCGLVLFSSPYSIYLRLWMRNIDRCLAMFLFALNITFHSPSWLIRRVGK